MVDVYSAEPERRKALEELTALRRELKTETAKGAKAAAKDPRFIAAKEKLDAAKSAAGMRTSAQDLAALNKIATSDTATMKRDEQGRMTAAPTRAERDVTKQLNAPSKQYFKQVQQAYKNPDQVPTWKPKKELTEDIVNEARNQGFDYSKARYDWVWNEVPGKKPQWAIGLVGTRLLPPGPYRPGVDDPADYAFKAYTSDSITAKEWLDFVQQNKVKGTSNPFGININQNEIVEALPDIRYTEIQEIIYRLTLERDTDITIEDILDKYDELYGEG